MNAAATLLQAAAQSLAVDEAAGDAPIDHVDAFLAARRSAFTVSLVGTNIHVRLKMSQAWTTRYSNRALSEAAMGAALNTLYMGGVTAERAKHAFDTVIGQRVKYTPATQRASTNDAEHLLIIDHRSRLALADALNLKPQDLVEAWRLRVGEARLLALALQEAHGALDKLEPHFVSQQLEAARMSVPLIRFLLSQRLTSIVEVARTHRAAAPWRLAFARNLALYWAEREPQFSDLEKMSPAQWAATVLELASVTRKALEAQHVRDVMERQRQTRNDHLRPHEIKVTDAAKFVLDTYDDRRTVKLYTTAWDIRGGLRLANVKGQPIFLLRADDREVVFQNVTDRKFYRQSLEGFSDEQLYGVFVEAARKSAGVLTITKWVIGVIGAVFPVVRYGVLAADVMNAAAKLQRNRAELERHYEGLTLAYGNVDRLLPGVLPRVWDAVLDKRNAALFNPLHNPDLGAWFIAILRIVMMRQARVVSASYASDAVHGFLNKAWAGVKKGAGGIYEVVVHVIVLAKPIAGSTGVPAQRALDMAQRRLKDMGVADAVGIVNQVKQLSAGDRDRVGREIQDLVASGTALIGLIKQTLSW